MAIRQKRPISIEPLIIPPEKMERLKTILAKQDTTNSQTIKTELGKVSGKCTKCAWLASTILKYKVQGVIIIERYCDECLKSVPFITRNAS